VKGLQINNLLYNGGEGFFNYGKETMKQKLRVSNLVIWASSSL